jgi:hypothetical protein
MFLESALPVLWGLFFIVLLVADIGVIVALHSFMMKRVPFRNVEPAIARASIPCSSCGTAVPATAAFCSNCGTRPGGAEHTESNLPI